MLAICKDQKELPLRCPTQMSRAVSHLCAIATQFQ